MTTVTKGKIQRGDCDNYAGTLPSSRTNSSGGSQTGLKIGNEVDVLTVFGSEDTDNMTLGTINAATGALGSQNVALVFAPGTWTIDDNLTIASNFTVVFPAGCVFSISSGKTVTVAGVFFRQHGTYSSGDGTFTITGNDILLDTLNVGADISSATELLVNISGVFHDVTGTTTITSLEAITGWNSVYKVLQFDGILTLTHHSTNLILPGGANITTAAGDIGVFYQYASGDWRCVSYQRANAFPFSTDTKASNINALAGLAVTDGNIAVGNGSTWVAESGSTARVSLGFSADTYLGGAWTTPSFDAGNFTANDSMTWTVAAGDVTTYAYIINGKAMTVAFTIATTTVGGTPSTTLQIAIPASKTATKSVYAAVKVDDNGTGETGFMFVSASGTVINIQKGNGGNYSASTNNTFVGGQITFEID